MAYCEVGDLLTGNIPTPAWTSPEKYVNDAADEIDSKIGFVYETPIDISDPTTVSRPVVLLLKRLNVFLATGRLLMAVDAAGEDDQLHAYALRLIEEATLALDAIATGKIDLDGATPISDDTAQVSAPLLVNKDAESNVEAFYDRIANPDFSFAGWVST